MLPQTPIPLYLGATLLLLTACQPTNQSNQAIASASETSASSTNLSSKPANSKTNKVLNIYNWSDYVDPDTVKAFAQKHQVKIRYDHYDTNETLDAKVLIGNTGYDLVVPTMNTMSKQIKAGAYQIIDKSKIPNYQQIDPLLLAKMANIDKGNEHAIPYFWGVNTIGINVDKVKKALGSDKLPDNEWDLLFKPEYASKLKQCGISILDSQLDVVSIVLRQLGKEPGSNNIEDQNAAFAQLQKIRPYIKRFSSSGYIDDLARGDLCLTLGYGGDLNIAKRRAKEANNGVNIRVLTPKTGMVIWVDALAIPKDAKNLDMAYAYINDTLDPKVAAKNGDFVSYAPGSAAARQYMNPEYVNDPSIFPTPEIIANSFMQLEQSPEVIRHNIRQWQRLKSGK